MKGWNPLSRKTTRMAKNTAEDVKSGMALRKSPTGREQKEKLRMSKLLLSTDEDSWK